MPVSATVPCPVEGCDGEVDVEVGLKVKSPPAKPGHKPGVTLNVSADGITLVGDHMRKCHPEVKIPERLLPR